MSSARSFNSCWLIVTLTNITRREHGLHPGITSRGSPTLVIAAASITLLKTDLVVSLLVRLFVGPNPLDEEAMKFAMGISSLTLGFTIWSSNGCDCLLSSLAMLLR